MFYSSLVLERQRVAQLCNIPAPDVHMLKYFLFFFYFFFFPTASILKEKKIYILRCYHVLFTSTQRTDLYCENCILGLYWISIVKLPNSFRLLKIQCLFITSLIEATCCSLM